MVRIFNFVRNDHNKIRITFHFLVGVSDEVYPIQICGNDIATNHRFYVSTLDEDVASSPTITLSTTKSRALPIYIKIDKPDEIEANLSFIRSQRGAPLLVRDGFIYRCERNLSSRTYWLCTGYKRHKCNGRIICQGNEIVKSSYHIHAPDWARINKSTIEFRDMSADYADDFIRGEPGRCNKAIKKD